VNSVTFCADTSSVYHGTDSYFVRLNAGPTPPPGSRTDDTPPARAPRRPRRRRYRGRGKRTFLVILLVGLGAWTYWAMQRPGGVSGTINGFIDHLRGDVAKVSADPDLTRAVNTFKQQYATNGAYSQMGEDQVGIAVTVNWCSSQAVVVQGTVEGGTVSRLLLAGKDLGNVQGNQGCPANYNNPAPWKLK